MKSALPEHYGKLTPEELKELDSLILELQKINNGPIPNRQQVKVIKPLPEPKNSKLWEYMMHMITLTLMLPDNLSDIKKVASKDPFNTVSDYCRDLPLQLAPFVYRYMWRKYKHSEECGYLITTAKYAFMTWKLGKISVPENTVESEDEFDGRLSNKVVTKNFS